MVMNTQNIFQREKLLIGDESFSNIQNTTIMLVGLGGVGSYCFESLIRAGFIHLILVDCDKYEATNINRQLYALNSTLGKAKIKVCAERAKDINPNIQVEIYESKVQDLKLDEIIKSKNTYIIDCIDDINGKLFIYNYTLNNDLKLISCMGTGNKLHSTDFKITTLNNTKVCPLSKKIRKIVSEKLGKEALNKINIVYSEESPISNIDTIVPSISYVPARAGLLLSEYVICDILHLR